MSALLERAATIDPDSPDAQVAHAECLRIEAEIFAWQEELMCLRADMSEASCFPPDRLIAIDDAQAELFEVQDGLVWIRAALLRSLLPGRLALDPFDPTYESPAEAQR